MANKIFQKLLTINSMRILFGICIAYVLFYNIPNLMKSYPPIVLQKSMHLLCYDGTFPPSQPCLCMPQTITNNTDCILKISSLEDQLRLMKTYRAACALTVNALGHLGNLMGEYATLYGLAQINHRPAFVLPEMATVLLKYFNLSLPVINEEIKTKYFEKFWTPMELQYWMEDSYANLNETFILITGYQYSWTYFHHLRDEILREFTFQPNVITGAQKKLHAIGNGRNSTTFVGVHARRGDYVELMKKPRYQGVVAVKKFFKNATDYFRAKYADAVFVVASDDMKWCKENIDNSKGDVYFMGNSNTKDPIDDLAMLANCNHSIITIGTFGFWTAYLAGGETVHLVNYMYNPGAAFLDFLKYDKLYLPNWIPVSADLSSEGGKNN